MRVLPLSLYASPLTLRLRFDAMKRVDVATSEVSADRPPDCCLWTRLLSLEHGTATYDFRPASSSSD